MKTLGIFTGDNDVNSIILFVNLYLPDLINKADSCLKFFTIRTPNKIYLIT